MADTPNRSVATHALQRSIAKLAVGVAQDITTKAERTALSSLGEREEQFQVRISGIASDYPLWTEVVLSFSQTFSMANGQRMSELSRPQFRTGFEMENAVSSLPVDATEQNPDIVGVQFFANIVRWTFDGAGNIVGAHVALAACAPGDSVVFTGYAHLCFQGWGALTDMPDDGD